MALTTKKWIRIVLALTLLILFFQFKKRNGQIEKIEKEQHYILSAGSDFAKITVQRPIYADSIYKIYIAKVKKKNKLLFLRTGELSNVQKESKFFVHIYPKDKERLSGNANHIPVNFNANFTSFSVNGIFYNVAHTELPDYLIEKLNLGQYGYRGDTSINYKISRLISSTEIAGILKENKESMAIFQYVEDTF